MNQRRTKERPKNSKLEKVLFIKIGISFAFLIPTLILPRELRLTTERTPTQLHLQKVLFVEIGSLKRFPLFLKKLTPILKRLSPFLKKLSSFLKRLTHFLKLFTYLFQRKTHQNAISLAQSKIIH